MQQAINLDVSCSHCWTAFECTSGDCIVMLYTSWMQPRNGDCMLWDIIWSHNRLMPVNRHLIVNMQYPLSLTKTTLKSYLTKSRSYQKPWVKHFMNNTTSSIESFFVKRDLVNQNYLPLNLIRSYDLFDSLITEICSGNAEMIIPKRIMQKSSLGTRCEIALRWMPQNSTCNYILNEFVKPNMYHISKKNPYVYPGLH